MTTATATATATARTCQLQIYFLNPLLLIVPHHLILFRQHGIIHIFQSSRRLVSVKIVPRIDSDQFNFLDVNGIDPSLALGHVEALLLNKAYEDVEAEPRPGDVLADLDESQVMLLTLTDQLQSALAGASSELLRQVAVPWSQIEEFGGVADPEDLASFLGDIATLAKRAEEKGEKLYCQVVV